MNYSISVIAPFLNEEANLRSFLSRSLAVLKKIGADFEIILIDDGSSDKSREIVESFMTDTFDCSIKLIVNTENSGLLASWTKGLEQSSKQLSVLIDTDLQNPPEAIPKLLDEFTGSTCHFVQGVRSSIEFGNSGRLLMSRTLNFFLNLVFLGSAKDHKSGFLIGPTSLFLDSLRLPRGLRYGQTFVRAAIERRGYLIREIETIFYPRRAGKSFLAGRELFASLVVLYETIIVAFTFRWEKTNRFFLFSPDQIGGQQFLSRRGMKETIWFWLFFTSLPLHTWNISRKTLRYLNTLSVSDWADGPTIKKLQSDRLSRLLWHAFGRVPHYRNFFVSQRILPDAIKEISDLTSLPLLDKEDVRDSLFFDLFSIGANRRRLHRIATSGSTGSPFVTYADRDQLDVRFATTIRAQQMTGWKFGDRQLRMWHQNLGLSRVQEVRERLNALVSRRTFVPAFELDSRGLDKLLGAINKSKPVLIDGYAESFNYLAAALESKQLLHQPAAIMTSAQILTDQVREKIENQLGASVFDKYGSREFSGIAYECAAHSGHHVQWESYLVEILKGGRPAKPGEVGEIVITDLNNFSVPLIRYRIGDLAEAQAPESCSCGRQSMKIGKIVGRTQALVKVEGEKWLPGTFFAHFFKEYDDIVGHFQIVQEKENELILRIVQGQHWSEDSWQACLTYLREYVGDGIVIKEEFVREIPLLRTGKRTPVISNLLLDFQSKEAPSI